MEIMVVYLLLLLVCSVSAGQTEAEKEILDKQISLQQPCLQDIHAVLREMTASLAEQKLKITLLEKENQEHATSLERQKTETEQLKKQLQVKQVAFSASLLDTGHGFAGPFNTQTILIFRRVVTNIGNAYNPQTGIFAAPVRGAYHFEWHILGIGDIQAGAVLFRNAEHIYLGWEHQSSYDSSGSNGASLLLEAGDQVFLRLWPNARIFDNQFHHTTFSGHLIFTM